jgi:hypothetical protein
VKRVFVAVLGAVLAVPALAGAQSFTDVYHVHFAKAVPGQAAQLGDELKKPYPTDPMPEHALVLRHQEGDDWDYCVITHMGTSATIKAGPAPAAATALRAMTAWHADSYVLGPSWPDFAKAMGISDGASTGNSLYVLALWREKPGSRDQLKGLLQQQTTGSKVPVSDVLLQHAEGGPWTFIALSRYNSWQDFATDEAGTIGAQGWAAVRAQSTFHRDTLADRISQR